MENRKVILYIAMSLDGFIAAPNDDLSFLSLVEQEGEDYGYAAFVGTVDTVIIGRKTYDWVMKAIGLFPHADKQAFVVTRTPREPVGHTTFFTGELTGLVQMLKQQPGGNIFVDGGAELANALLAGQQIDELVVSVIPVLLGDGVRLFKEGNTLQTLTLVSSKAFEKGLVQLHYQRNGIESPLATPSLQ